ncbi:bifunctional DNA primase/polymerase [Actinomadura sp. NPDC048032]|uniref:bifunctional DNA primase/polymerase n=1 Tax=Actinomadura sp. NPDC048032 TaxID=3155747 RepID=UPI0033FC70F9
MVTRKRAALAHTERNWAVFPCGTPRDGHAHPVGSDSDCESCKAEKRPRSGWKWKQRNSANPAVISEHWPTDEPNIGVACAASRLVVIDLDTPAHGGTIPEEWRALGGINEGADVLAYLLEQQGEAWPDTFTVKTASGGFHLYFTAIEGRHVPNSTSKVGPMIDVRGDRNSDGSPGGGYVLGVGSVVGGAEYTVVNPAPALPLPEWLADLAAPPAPPTPIRTPLPQATGEARPHSRFVGLVDTVLNAPKGQRNNVLHWAACRAAEMVREGGVDRNAAFRALAQAAEQIGLGDREVQNTISSAFGRAA